MLVHAHLGAISPGWGVGEIRLGMVCDEVRRIAGEPVEEIEQDEDACRRLSYPGEAHLFFHPEENGRLTLILFEDPDALRGVGIDGAPIEERAVLAWMGDARCKVEETDEGFDEGERQFERWHDYREHGFCFWSDESGDLTACGVFVVIDANDEYCWPPPGSPAPAWSAAG